MKKIEAATLEEAYALACDDLGCSMSELKYEIVQYPSKGFIGLFAKPAIIVAMAERKAETESRPAVKTVKEENTPPPAETKVEGVKKKPKVSESVERRVEERIAEKTPAKEVAVAHENSSEEKILEGFFTEGVSETSELSLEERNRILQQEIEEALRELIEKSCFDIDVVEVDVIEDTAYIYMDGEDAALIIGKEGYRYNALSYLLYNWIHTRYQLYIKLEIARFLASQEEMIRNTIQSVIEHVECDGWGRTRPLDGILVQIALEQLREAFPDKYVAIKRQRDGKRYILINEFNKRK